MPFDFCLHIAGAAIVSVISDAAEASSSKGLEEVILTTDSVERGFFTTPGGVV